MIYYTDSTLFESHAKVLVNTVNTRGVMGKGLALRFKQIYPEMFKQYRQHCEQGNLTIGKLWLYKTPNKWILNFPTKDHWRYPSRLEFIEAGLKKFSENYAHIGINSIAFPMLGCGNGELDFNTQVRPLMEIYLDKLHIPAMIHIYDKPTDPPEHYNPVQFKKLLRSVPFALPFEEVWDDLQQVLGDNHEFKTLKRKNKFTVRVVNDPRALVIYSSGRVMPESGVQRI